MTQRQLDALKTIANELRVLRGQLFAEQATDGMPDSTSDSVLEARKAIIKAEMVLEAAITPTEGEAI